jgi:hypothetical protein
MIQQTYHIGDYYDVKINTSYYIINCDDKLNKFNYIYKELSSRKFDINDNILSSIGRLSITGINQS